MKSHRIAGAMFLAAMFAAAAGSSSPAVAQSSNGNAQIIVTAQSKRSQPDAVLQPGNLSVSIKNRPAEITSLTPLRGGNDRLQLVFLFDDGARTYLALQNTTLRTFINSLPRSTEVAIAYMSNGRAVMAQTFTRDHELAGNALRIPNGIRGINASPYFCISDLAKNWPAPPSDARRVVLMVTNGEDPYNTGGGPQDPYLDTATADAQKAGMLVYSIFFRDRGRSGPLRTFFGQTFLQRLADDTGGEAYANLLSISPVSFEPYLRQFRTTLQNQYRLSFVAPDKGLQRIKVKSTVRDLRILAPTAVNVSAAVTH